MKWLSRDEWRAAFDELVDRHLRAACEAAGISRDELSGALDREREVALLGCIFEDFLATDLSDGSNIIDDYLKRRGWKESVPNKRYMTALRTSVMSLYEVSDIVRDQSFLARDLLRGGEPVRVSEKKATHALRPWDLLAARVLQVGPRLEMAGGVLPLTRELGEIVRDRFVELERQLPAEMRQDIEAGHGGAPVDQFTFQTEILRYSAFLFIDTWVDDVLERVLHPRLPDLVNSDGDEIVLTTVRYPLKESADRETIERALAAMPGLRRADANLWSWSAPAARGSGAVPKGAPAAVASVGDGTISMGEVEVAADSLMLKTNSPQRAQRGQALLDPLIARFVGEPVVESSRLAELMTRRPPADEGASSSPLSSDQERAFAHETLERHYRTLLDQPVPMLGNVSPRAAAETATGRQKLVDWLKYLENLNARHEAHSPMATYDLSWMWDELGIAASRQ
jgi:hypothetical protein